MEENSGRVSFNKDQKYPPLRKPKTRGDVSNSAESCNHAGSLLPEKKSTSYSRSGLSPHAPEFFPMASSSQCNTSQFYSGDTEKLSDNIRNMNINANMSEKSSTNFPIQKSMNSYNSVQDSNFYSKVNYSPLQNSETEEYDASHTMSEQSEEEKSALNYITSAVSFLNDNPGSFDTIASKILSDFKGFGDNEFVLSNAMEIIFNKSIEEQNFRYMGAKLYSLIDSIKPQDNSTFRSLLSCKLSYHEEEILTYMQNEQHKVRGSTLFLAELYMQLRNDEDRIVQLAESIVFAITQLLQKTTPENVKCICLTLKLAGYDLEMDCPVKVASIIGQLKLLDSLDVATSRILEMVLMLQKTNWGRTDIGQLPYPSENPTVFVDTPVFYGPDGQVLTEEENYFLESNLPRENNIEEDNDSDEIDFDPEMDAEMELAYRDFLKGNAKRC